MSEKLKMIYINEDGDKLTLEATTEEMLGFRADEYWKLATEFYQKLSYQNPVDISISGDLRIVFSPEIGVDMV